MRARTPQPYPYTPYMERTDSCVSRFATAEGCAPALLLAHASARADLAARLALFERALFPAGAAVRDAGAARGRGDATSSSRAWRAAACASAPSASART